MDQSDWRLQRQESVLLGKKLIFQAWKAPSDAWDHEHCAFCWDKLSDADDSLHEGYATEDGKFWVCPTCFQDFKDRFQWIVDARE